MILDVLNAIQFIPNFVTKNLEQNCNMNDLIDSYIHSRYELNDYCEIGDMFEAKTVNQDYPTAYSCIECGESFPIDDDEILSIHVEECHSELMPRREHYALP